MEKILKPGDLMWTWCSKHMERTDHLWNGHKLICLECHKDKDPRLKEEQSDERDTEAF